MNIHAFCARHKTGRYDFTLPWAEGGWEYATDARIAVRMPTEEPDTHGRLLPPLGLHPLWGYCRRAATPWPGHDGTTEVKRCKETAVVQINCGCLDGCARCDGMGFTAHGGHPHPCEVCGDRRTIQAPTDQMFGSWLLGGEYVALIDRELSGVFIVGVYYYHDDKDPDSVVAFSADDGVEGLLAPRRM